ncbi:RNA-binding protein squid-like [Aethina tumida]|uniref:RNA-binding protein squid-like n=1 Tax=Aethina tumida TaxID=116153 RepID=UPI0021481376|nr:RNA-binding protein squid-like [Aethina tumida]
MESNGQETNVAPASAPAPAPAPTSTTTDSSLRKIFVGGISQETTEAQLKEYFTEYGSIEAIRLKTDPNTGNSKGFAFIVFTSTEALEAIFAKDEHTINNKKVDVQKAKIKEGKLFVGGINADMSEDDIKNHFGQFGKITKAEFPIDKTKNQRKAFCFITFESDSIVNQIAKTRKQTIKGKEVDVKKAMPQEKSFGDGFNPGFGQGFRSNNVSLVGGRGRGGARGRGGFQNRRGGFKPRGGMNNAQGQGNGWTSFGDNGANYSDFGANGNGYGYNQGYGGNGQGYGGNDQGYGGYGTNGNANGGFAKQKGFNKGNQQRFTPY